MYEHAYFHLVWDYNGCDVVVTLEYDYRKMHDCERLGVSLVYL